MYTTGSCSGGGDGSSLCVLIQNQKGACSSQPLDSSFLSASSSSPFLSLMNHHSDLVLYPIGFVDSHIFLHEGQHCYLVGCLVMRDPQAASARILC